MITVQYFASVREAMERDSQHLELPDSVTTVAGLMDLLASEDERFAQLCSSGNPLLIAVNQTVVDPSAPLSGNDEVAFFPPMTGG